MAWFIHVSISNTGTISVVPAQSEKAPVRVQASDSTEDDPDANESDISGRTLILTPRASYGKLKSGNEKPKVPRQIREIQENLTFEKIRRTGAKNNAR